MGVGTLEELVVGVEEGELAEVVTLDMVKPAKEELSTEALEIASGLLASNKSYMPESLYR